MLRFYSRSYKPVLQATVGLSQVLQQGEDGHQFFLYNNQRSYQGPADHPGYLGDIVVTKKFTLHSDGVYICTDCETGIKTLIPLSRLPDIQFNVNLGSEVVNMGRFAQGYENLGPSSS